MNKKERISYYSTLDLPTGIDFGGEKFTPKIRALMLKSLDPNKFKEVIGRDARLRLHYPELIAQSYNDRKPIHLRSSVSRPDKWIPKCSFSLLRLKCESGHLISKAIYCGREWCEVCGQKDSVIHKRRMSNWTPRAKQIDSMGYLVVTIPKEIRTYFQSKHDLNEFRTYIRRKLKREFPKSRGFIRWHFAGDCKRCQGKKCDNCNHTGAGSEYHPHLNILMNSGFIDKNILLKFRIDIENWLSDFTGVDCTSKGNINYQYSSIENKKRHFLKYVTRATWRIYHPDICKIIKYYRVGVPFGKFDKTDECTELEAIQNKCCPVCLIEDGVINKLKKQSIQANDGFNWSLQKEIKPGIFVQIQPKINIRR